MADHLHHISIDSFTPAQVAARVESVGVSKAHLPLCQTLTLGVMAGAFIAFGAMSFITAMAQGLPRIMASVLFCLGLILVVIGGGELFTGNNLIVMAWAQGKVKNSALIRNWGWVYSANLIGSLGAVGLAYLSGMLHTVDMQFGVQALIIAAGKTSLSFQEAFFKATLCNALVCLAVWLCYAARSVADRVFAIIFPISAFVNMGLEHSIANMFFIPLGMLAKMDSKIVAAANVPAEQLAQLDLHGFLHNIAAVTLGNILGGTVLVAGMYYLVYLRDQPKN